MKKGFLLKGMTAAVVALAVVGCSKETNLYDQNSKVEESAANFVNNVLGGRAVDANQTWSTAQKVMVNVESEMAGTLKIYTANPHGNVTAPLLTQTITVGKASYAVAKPADATELFASLNTSDGSMNVVRITDNRAYFKAPTAIPASSRRAARAPQAPTAEGWTFAEAPKDAMFEKDYPTEIHPKGEYWAYGGNNGIHTNYYLDDTETEQQIGFWKGNADIYVKGKKTINFINPGDGSAAVVFHILTGADVTFVGDFNYQKGDAMAMFINSGAKVTFNGALSANVNLYNRGEVTVNGVTGPYADGVIYNQGTITSKKNMAVFNNGSQVINDGTWTVAEGVTVEGSGHIQNLGNMTVTGLTLVNSNNCTWVNDGTWRTDNYTYNAGSTDVINNCRLFVNELFTINLGDTDKNCFAINAGGGVETKNFHFAGPGYIKMAGDALFKVTNEAKMDATKADYGFWGPTTGDKYAVIAANKIVTTNESQMYDITYGGNVLVACDTHFPNSYPGGANDPRPVIDLIGNAKIVKGQNNADYQIAAEGNCNGGYNGRTGGDGDDDDDDDNEPTMYYYYAFEDLGTTDDFDFNDAVIRLSAPVNGTSSVEIVAAGGTLEAYITYGEGENPTVIGAEIHSAMGSNSTSTMINTSSVDASKFAVLGTIPVAADADLTALPFGLKVTGTNGETVRVTRSVANNGKSPLVIVVNGNEQGKWFWATERTNIGVAYSGFGDWGANVGTNANWYKNATGSVVSY